jgi:hypothetical protein
LLIFFCGSVLRKCSEEFSRLASFARRREDCAVVLLEEGDPIGDITRVSKLALNPQVSAEERCREFGDQLLGCIGLGAEAVLEIAVEPLFGRRPMTIMPMSA